jgi:ribose transport system substrate-binding protein
VALATGGTKPSTTVYPNTPFENSVTGNPHPVMCDANLPGDIYLSAQLPAKTQAAIVNGK